MANEISAYIAHHACKWVGGQCIFLPFIFPFFPFLYLLFINSFLIFRFLINSTHFSFFINSFFIFSFIFPFFKFTIHQLTFINSFFIFLIHFTIHQLILVKSLSHMFYVFHLFVFSHFQFMHSFLYCFMLQL